MPRFISSPKILKQGFVIKHIVMIDIPQFLEEDLGTEGDITSEALFTSEQGKGSIIAKDKGILAGIDEIKQVFQLRGATVRDHKKNGEPIKKGDVVATVEGPLRAILSGERVALNILGRMSGIATETQRLLIQCKKINPQVKIAATRKTTPGFRKYEKNAVKIGGGEPHRQGLFDAYLIKDNHLIKTKSITEAITQVQKHNISGKIVEIEVENEPDALAAANLNVDVIMLDNFDSKKGKLIAERIRKINPNVLIEVSGGITNDNIKEYAIFADRISLGCLTHSVKSLDFSLEIQ
jgi:nicotinate-nucleotide pyrophosphorylase (carboxylating)